MRLPDIQKVPMEKHVAAPPIMMISWFSVSAILEPTINGCGTLEIGITSLVTACISDSVVEKTTMSFSWLTVPSQPTPPRTINESRY